MGSARATIAVLIGALWMACAPLSQSSAASAPPRRVEPIAKPVRPAPPPSLAPAPVRGKQPEPEQAPVTAPSAAPEPPAPVRHPFHEAVSKSPAEATAFRLAKLSPRECRAELERRKLPVKRLGGDTRGIATALRLTGPLHGVRFVAPGGKSKFGLLDCRLALTLDELARVLGKHGVVEVRVDNFYRPSAKLPGRPIKSQHHYGLAMDVMELRLEGGRTLQVERDWHGTPGSAACGPEAAPTEPSDETIALRNLVCDIVRAGIFHHVLTPSYNAAHRNHLHLDIKREGWAIIVR